MTVISFRDHWMEKSDFGTSLKKGWQFGMKLKMLSNSLQQSLS